MKRIGSSGGRLTASGPAVAVLVAALFLAPPALADTITTMQQPATGSVGSAIDDMATVTGLDNPSSLDMVAFNLYSSATTQNSSTLLYTDTALVSLTGSTATATSAGYTVAAPGTDYWVATFNGDTNNSAVTSNATAEPVDITQARPDITTTPGGTVVLGSSTALTDSAALTNGYDPTGTIALDLFGPGVTPNGSDTNDIYSDIITVTGNGTYDTANGTDPGGYIPTTLGTYQWITVYSGDSNNHVSSSPFGAAPESVLAPSTVPEPSSFSVLAASVIGMFMSRRRGRPTGGGQAAR
jgi:hypothetical protein